VKNESNNSKNLLNSGRFNKRNQTLGCATRKETKMGDLKDGGVRREDIKSLRNF
jgi:hypothetical protein